MAPIGVGLVGLTSHPTMNPHDRGNWAIFAHLSSIKASPNYHLAAVCNSSLESARKAIATHGLDGGVRPYGSVEDMARDPDVELVVVSVRAEAHYELARAAILGGKNVFVEWPLAPTLHESESLAALAAQQGVSAIVGAQIRADPLFSRVRELVRGGRIGEVRSSVYTACTSSIQWDSLPESGMSFVDWSSGANEFTIYIGHCLHGMTYALGDFETVQATMKNFGTTVRITNSDGDKTLDPAYRKTTPDCTFIQGVLANGAVASATFRQAKHAVDEAGFRWIVTGTKGEVEVVSPEGFPPIPTGQQTIRVRLFDGTSAEEVAVEDGSEPKHVKIPPPGTNTARVYEAFAAGRRDNYATFEEVVQTQRLLGRIVQSAGFP